MFFKKNLSLNLLCFALNLFIGLHDKLLLPQGQSVKDQLDELNILKNFFHLILKNFHVNSRDPSPFQ